MRVYREEGDKIDKEKRAYIGWSEALDEFFPAYSPRIQKSGTFAKSFDESKAQLG
jgi:hypothetical protein